MVSPGTSRPRKVIRSGPAKVASGTSIYQTGFSYAILRPPTAKVH